VKGKPIIHDSSGNVFADIGVKNPHEYLAKAKLAAEILKVIQSRRLTQTEAGHRLGVTQSKVSALLNGRLDGFSTDRLIRFLNMLGCDVQISISKSHHRRHGSVRVRAA
jgi:predicted XRE-type DNA-binding protein